MLNFDVGKCVCVKFYTCGKLPENRTSNTENSANSSNFVGFYQKGRDFSTTLSTRSLRGPSELQGKNVLQNNKLRNMSLSWYTIFTSEPAFINFSLTLSPQVGFTLSLSQPYTSSTVTKQLIDETQNTCRCWRGSLR